MIAISTPRSLAAGMIRKLDEDPTLPDRNTLICPMIDARRMEVYTALYNMGNREIREIRAEIINEGSFEDWLDKYPVWFLGDGASKCKKVLSHQENAHFSDDVLPSSGHMIDIAFERFNKQQFVDVAYFEPFYLKDFIAGKPKVKGLK